MTNKETIMPHLIKNVDDYIYCYGYRQLNSYVEKLVKDEVVKLNLAPDQAQEIEIEIVKELIEKFQR
jgi:hypothetical protein